MERRRRRMRVLGLGGLFGLALAIFTVVGLVRADAPPTPGEIDFATEVADLLQAELFAALLQKALQGVMTGDRRKGTLHLEYRYHATVNVRVQASQGRAM